MSPSSDTSEMHRRYSGSRAPPEQASLEWRQPSRKRKAALIGKTQTSGLPATSSKPSASLTTLAETCSQSSSLSECSTDTQCGSSTKEDTPAFGPSTSSSRQSTIPTTSSGRTGKVKERKSSGGKYLDWLDPLLVEFWNEWREKNGEDICWWRYKELFA